MTISISELEAARAWMTFRTATNDNGALLDEDGDEIGRVESTKDGAGLAATHNAADALIEIVKAAIALRDDDDEDRVDAIETLLTALAQVRP